MRIGIALVASVLASALSFGEPIAPNSPQRQNEKSEKKRLHPRNEATFQEILKAANDPNRDVRSRVAWIIGAAGREDAVNTLNRLAADPAPRVRAAALRAMCEALPAGTEIKVTLTVPIQDHALRNTALAAAEKLSFEQRDAVIQAGLESRSVSERAYAVRAFALDPPEKWRVSLLSTIADPHPIVRAAAVRILGRTDDAEAVKLVSAAFTENSAADSFLVRAAACDALALNRIKDSAAGELLRQAVSDEHYFVRRTAIQALTAIADKSGIPAIQLRLTDDDFTVREHACMALGEMINPASPSLLADRLDDEVFEVRAAAEAALVKFPSDMAYRALLKYVDYEKRVETWHRVWRILGWYGHPKTADVALNHIEDPDALVSGMALRIMRKLKDRRVIPHVIKISNVDYVDGGHPLSDLQASEVFQIAIVFELQEPAPLASLAFHRFIAPLPLYVPEPLRWLPRPPAVGWAAEYVGTINHRPAVPYLQPLTIPEHQRKFSANQDALDQILSVVEKLTGTRPEKIPFPKAGPSMDLFFIDVPPGEE